MIAVRDLVIFAGLMALVAATIASLYPAREGFSPPIHCGDCAYKLVGPYTVVQRDYYAALLLGEREVEKFAWAYHTSGAPFRVNETLACTPLYVWVIGGVAFVSCSPSEPKMGKRLW